MAYPGLPKYTGYAIPGAAFGERDAAANDGD
jgi:hypothetical protein